MNFVKSIYSSDLLLKEKEEYSYYPELILCLVFLGAVLVSYTFTDVKVWGHKTESIMDIWSIVHIATGISISGILINLRKICPTPLVILMVIVGYWEIYEPYFETVVHPIIVEWFGGTEHWINRGFADPMCAFFGFYIVKRHPGILPYVRIFSFIFLFFHIVVLQNSMYFHL